ARRAAWEFLAQSNSDSLQHALIKTRHSTSSNTATFRADHYLVKSSQESQASQENVGGGTQSSIGDISTNQEQKKPFRNTTYVMKQEPVESTPTMPLGQFAYVSADRRETFQRAFFQDISLKHLDAHHLFQFEFQLWAEQQGLGTD